MNQQRQTLTPPYPGAAAVPCLPHTTGVAHFTEEQGFKNMYPHTGAWGLWYLPGSKRFREWGDPAGGHKGRCLWWGRGQCWGGKAGSGSHSGWTRPVHQLLMKATSH